MWEISNQANQKKDSLNKRPKTFTSRIIAHFSLTFQLDIKQNQVLISSKIQLLFHNNSYWYQMCNNVSTSQGLKISPNSDATKKTSTSAAANGQQSSIVRRDQSRDTNLLSSMTSELT